MRSAKLNRGCALPHVDPVAEEGHALGLEQRALALSLGQRAIGADDAVPGHALVVAGVKHGAGKPWGAGGDIAVGAHEAGRYGADTAQDGLSRGGHRPMQSPRLLGRPKAVRL